MTRSLEERLEKTRVEANVLALGVTHKSLAGQPCYLKYDLVGAILDYCKRFRTSPTSNALNSLNKEPLKTVYYGMTKSRNVPEKIISALTDWEKIYFFAGMNSSISLEQGMRASQIVARVLLEGIKNVCARHNAFKTRPTTYGARKPYRTKPKVPFAKKIGAECKKILSAPDDLAGLLSRDDLSEEEQERVAIMLDSCSYDELRELKALFGSEKLGGYDPDLLQKQGFVSDEITNEVFEEYARLQRFLKAYEQSQPLPSFQDENAVSARKDLLRVLGINELALRGGIIRRLDDISDARLLETILCDRARRAREKIKKYEQYFALIQEKRGKKAKNKTTRSPNCSSNRIFRTKSVARLFHQKALLNNQNVS